MMMRPSVGTARLALMGRPAEQDIATRDVRPRDRTLVP